MNANLELPQTVLEWPAEYNHIPKAVFEAPGLWELELEKIFYGQEWHPIVHRAEIPNPGDYKAAWIGEMPIFAVHGDDGQIRIFHNACAHRGATLITDAAGCKQEYECPYHRWLFNSRGEMVGGPNMDEYSPSFSKEQFGLRQLRTEQYCELYFVTMSDQTPSLSAYLTPVLMDPLARNLGGDGRLKLLGYQKVTYDCNWKAYGDNDSWHAPLLHLAFKLLRLQGGPGRQQVTANGHLVFESEATPPNSAEGIGDTTIFDFRGTDTSQGAIVLSTFPMTVFTKHLDMLNIRYAFPTGPRGVEVHYAYFAHEDDDEAMVRHRIRQSSNLLGPCGLVSAEDAAVFSRIQLGNRSPGDAIFQKGVRNEHEVPFDLKQNDESGNIARWEYYRKTMGFRRTNV